MKKLSEKEQKEVNEVLKMIGETLLKTMYAIEAENFISCNFTDEDTKEVYHLRIEKVK